MVKGVKFYTVGHSIRSLEEFISLLKSYSIEVVVDIRAFPVSRRNPRFNRENLEPSLSRSNIEYVWFGKEFGGYRRKKEGLGEKSPNLGWEKEGFRIYADYMMSNVFKDAAKKLVELASDKKVAYMCAEKFYWRCHRRLLSDYLLSQDHEVWHIVDSTTLRRHELTTFARLESGTLTYPKKAAGCLFRPS